MGKIFKIPQTPDPAEDDRPSLLTTITNLPSALSRLVGQCLLLSAGGLAAFLLLLTQTREFNIILLPIVFVVWGVARGGKIVWDYRAGNIVERVLVCLRVTYMAPGGEVMGRAMARRVRVSFRTTDEENPEIYQYILPAKGQAFTPSAVYVTYTRKSEPKILMAYTAI